MDNKTYIIERLCASSVPVKRSELAEELNISARKVEKEIAELRERGIRICGMSGKSGYYFPKSEQEFKSFLNDYTARAWTTIRRARRMEFFAEGQQEMK